MNKKTKILLTNGHAVNNGDMALVIALYNALKKKGFEVSIATFRYNFLKKQYPELPFVRELLDYKFPVGATFVKKIYLKLNLLFNYKYKSFDAYIGSPGGYMNSYYGLKKCLLPLVEAKKRNKKTAVYSQSVGPLNKRDINLYSKSIDLLLVRDNYSKNCVDNTNCRSEVIQTKDAAFLIEPRKSNANNSKLVGISVRSWKHDNRNMEAYHKLIQLFCERVLMNGYDIEFISTCQGVPNYVDDSKTAAIIVKNILKKTPSLSNRIKIDSLFHSYFDLVDILNTRYSFVIGTRLHMCMLSLINGTPAFNISYEVKGKECYNYLGLEDYTSDFNASEEEAISKLDLFISNYKIIQKDISETILTTHKESIKDLDQFLKEMEL